MVLSNAERQERYRKRLRDRADAAYEIEIMQAQIAALETAVNEARAAVQLPEIQLPKSAYIPRSGTSE